MRHLLSILFILLGLSQPASSQTVDWSYVRTRTMTNSGGTSYLDHYDHAGRLLSKTHRLDGGSEVTLLSNTYDELGRLSSSTHYGNETTLKTDYAYNVRSWTTSIDNPLFKEYLYYNTSHNGNTPQYGGNVSAMDWQTGSLLRGYTFGYDGFSRLIQANYLEAGNASTKYGTSYTYDKMGNILSLERYGRRDDNTFGLIDEICAMLEESGQDYLRLGSEASCDPRYAYRLLSNAFSDKPKLDDIRRRLESVPIVVSTTLTLLTRPFLFAVKHFSLCIVDEASQILEPYLIGLLSSNRIDRFILIGDHKQLPAVVAQPDDDPRLHDCRLSLFERLFRQEREAGRQLFTDILQHQGRMHPDIAVFPNEWFYRHEKLQPVPCPHHLETELDYREPSEDALDDQLKQHRVLFIPADDEASLVADLLRRLYRQIGSEHFDSSRSIGVIVTYRHQIIKIRREIAKLNLPPLLDISIDTVERYQGSQRDVIIYSLGVQNAADLDFLTSNCFVEEGRVIDRKLNVAMTRARKQLLMTGNRDVLCRNAIFQEIIHRYSV